MGKLKKEEKGKQSTERLIFLSGPYLNLSSTGNKCIKLTHVQLLITHSVLPCRDMILLVLLTDVSPGDWNWACLVTAHWKLVAGNKQTHMEIAISFKNVT